MNWFNVCNLLPVDNVIEDEPLFEKCTRFYIYLFYIFSLAGNVYTFEVKILINENILNFNIYLREPLYV